MLKLSIVAEEDKELRDFVQRLVKGQLQKMARKDMRLLLKEVVGDEMEKWVKSEISIIIDKYLGKNSYTRNANVQNMLKEIMSDIINERLEIKTK